MRRALSLQFSRTTSQFGLGDLWQPTSSRGYLELLDCESLVFVFFEFQFETPRTNRGRMPALAGLPTLAGLGQDSQLYYVLRNAIPAFDMRRSNSCGLRRELRRKRDNVTPEQLT